MISGAVLTTGPLKGGDNAQTAKPHSAVRCDRDRPCPFDRTFLGAGAGARAEGWIYEKSPPRRLAGHHGEMGEDAWGQADACADGVQRFHGKGHRDAYKRDRSVRRYLA